MASVSKDKMAKTLSADTGGGEGESGQSGRMEATKEPVYERKLTVQIELSGNENVTTLELLKCVRELCGGVIACRSLGVRKFEVTMTSESGKRRLMDGFKIGSTMVTGKELANDELVVSFLGLPAYTTDDEIVEKLSSWGVSATSPIKRRMWPGTRIADGTRFMKVKFNDTVQSLPYSARFNTAMGPEYFRVIHDRQVRVCRLCIQPGHVVRDCPEFSCHRCGVQGHYARECTKNRERCVVCHNDMDECVCVESEDMGDLAEAPGSAPEESESEEEQDGNDADMECVSEGTDAGAADECGGSRRRDADGVGAQERVAHQEAVEARVSSGEGARKDDEVEPGTDGGATAAARSGEPVHASAAVGGSAVLGRARCERPPPPAPDGF